MSQSNKDNLSTDLFKITFYGVVLIVVQIIFEERRTSESLSITTSFLAIIAVFKFIFPIRIYDKSAWVRVGCVGMCCLFSWWLVYSAENTRAAFYRLNVQRHKIERLVESAPCYVILSDSEGIITSTSDNIDLLTGYKPKELIGQPTTVLMLDAQSAKNQITYDKAVALLRDPYAVDAGWVYQGLITTALKNKNGGVVPVKIYSGGVRWSTDIQFKADIDMFAVYFPVEAKDALVQPTSLTNLEGRKIESRPIAPNVKPIVTVPYSTPTHIPLDKHDDSDIVRPK